MFIFIHKQLRLFRPGRPSPTVTWWRGGQKLLGSIDKGEDGLITNSVAVRVRPEDAQVPIVCQASNTHLVPPLRRPVMIQVMCTCCSFSVSALTLVISLIFLVTTFPSYSIICNEATLFSPLS